MREMKDSGIAWIRAVPKDWKIVRNKNVFTTDKELVGDEWNKTQLLSLTTKGIKAVDIGKTSGKVPDSYNTYQKVRKNNIVMCLFDLDCSAVFSGLSDIEGMISPAYKVLKVDSKSLPTYYKYWFEYIFDGRKFMYLSKNIRYTLTYDEFASLAIVLPSLEEQQRIAEFLDGKCAEIDQLVALQEQFIEELKAYKQSVITEAVTKGLDPNVAMKDSECIFYNKIPSHWKQTKTLRLLQIPITDGPHETPLNVEEGIPFISADAVSDGFINFANKWGNVSKEYYEECCKKYKPLKNDIYMIKSGASTGRTAIVETDEVFTIWSPLAVFRANPNLVLPYYLFYVLKSDAYLKQVETRWSYGTQQNIGMRVLETLTICYPSTLTEQQNIVRYLDDKCHKIDNLIAVKQQKIEELKEYKKSMIYEYVTGKKEVPTA